MGGPQIQNPIGTPKFSNAASERKIRDKEMAEEIGELKKQYTFGELHESKTEEIHKVDTGRFLNR